MCGIAGIINAKGRPVDAQLVEAMTNVLRHRGPDAAATYIDRNVGLGHRRLSVIDTSDAAIQPMFNEDGKVVVIFNGEIYNFRALRQELESLGHQFRTRSDTEVIVHAWEQFGPGCLTRLRGMFALAVYDARRREVFLARDRLGKKPLYYRQTPRCMAFASEIKALRCLPGFSRELDLDGLGEYVSYGHTLGPRTIYQHVRRLPPAHYLHMSVAGDRLEPKIERYWALTPNSDPTCSEDEWLERIDSEISEAVRLRLVSDVPLGAFLSGGIDSSLIVAYMTRHAQEPVRTFTMGFREPSHDESSYAAAVARHLGVEHSLQVVEPNAVDVLDDLIDVYDEPFADESAIPTFYLCQLTRRNVTVALSGDGGDETFLGYDRYPFSHWMHRLGRGITPLGRSLLGALSRRLPYHARLRRPVQRMSYTDFDLYHHAMGYSDEMLELLRKDVRAALSPPNETKMALDYARCNGMPIPDRYAYTDLHNYLPDDILVKVDRASMHHSLEVRCPLLDHKVVELAAMIPWHFKLRGLTGKRLLRTLLRRFLPDELIQRPKRGFGVPLVTWFRNELKPMLEHMIADDHHDMWLYFDRAAVERRVAAHWMGRADLHASLWRSLFFYHWSSKHVSIPDKTQAS